MRALRGVSELSAERFYVLDVFRGLAAVAILIWHYQSFYWFTPGWFTPGGGVGDRSVQPFYETLQLFYEHGNEAVSFFWMLSGFVFAATYHGKPVSAGAFALNRFARLYPLHFVTLLFAALVSFLAVQFVGRPTFPDNDLTHFIVHVFFASGWKPLPFSFNAPIWSVSVEVVIYAAFWCLLPVLRRWGVAISFVMISLSAGWFHTAAANPFASSFYFSLCALFFFAGVAVFQMHQSKIVGPVLRLCAGIGSTALGVWLIFHVQPYQFGLAAVFFGALILIALMEKTFARAWAARIDWLGDSTYSMYLWHQPLIFLGAIVLFATNLGTGVVASPLFFLGYIVAMLVIARVSFVAFERPMRRVIRGFARSRPKD